MSPWERWSLHGTTLLMAFTGLVYGWLRYYGQISGEFGLEPHPLQGLLQHLHVVAGPLQVFTLGMVVRAHVIPMLQRGNGRGRSTGLFLALALAPMVLSGYAIQVLDSFRGILAWVHGISSWLFLLGYGAHLARIWVKARAMNGLPEGA